MTNMDKMLNEFEARWDADTAGAWEVCGNVLVVPAWNDGKMYWPTLLAIEEPTRWLVLDHNGLLRQFSLDDVAGVVSTMLEV